jgi:hypothetical protein
MGVPNPELPGPPVSGHLSEGIDVRDTTQGDLSISSTEHQLCGEDTENAIPEVRLWSKMDHGDLKKLGDMMRYFLGVPRFAADKMLFSNLVVTPLMGKVGPAPGAIQVLEQVMSSVMFRHRQVSMFVVPGR